LGSKIRQVLIDKNYPSVAGAGFQAPCVIVSYTTDPEIQSGKKFIEQGLQTAAGVPLQCDEGPDYRSFRLGLFGIDKLLHVDRTVTKFQEALNKIE
jgi:aspartate aminotransferase-like enzyme